jgi:hypothetical protein
MRSVPTTTFDLKELNVPVWLLYDSKEVASIEPVIQCHRSIERISDLEWG